MSCRIHPQSCCPNFISVNWNYYCKQTATDLDQDYDGSDKNAKALDEIADDVHHRGTNVDVCCLVWRLHYAFRGSLLITVSSVDHLHIAMLLRRQTFVAIRRWSGDRNQLIVRRTMTSIARWVGMMTVAAAVHVTMTMLHQASFADPTVQNGSHTTHHSHSVIN